MARVEEQVITSASSRGRTLDVEERQKRYTITMSIRTLCFFAFLVVPGWWKIVALVGAAILPIFAVVLSNATDHRHPPEAPAADDDTDTRLALPSGTVIRGDVEPE